MRGLPVEQIRFGRTEAKVSAVSLGTWSHGGPNLAGTRSVGWSGGDPAAERASLLAAYEAGITHWDTADVYGDGRSEALIGEVLRELPRDAVFLATKTGWDPGPYEHAYHPRQVASQLEGSLRRLGVEQIDLYYLHHCDFGPGARHLDGALEVLARAREAGKFRHLGLSDWDARKIVEHLPRVDPDVVQPYGNVVTDGYRQSGLAALVAERDLGVAFFSPLRHGLLLGKYDAPRRFDAGDYRANDPWFADADVLARLRDHRDAVAALVDGPEPVLRGLVGALLTESPSACVLLGQRNPAQVAAAAAAAAPLEPQLARRIWELYADLRS
ncbi:MAG: aldo/keto reductase [Deltaproteobacteria bacterium]|nr:aldo/keto reductase [Deltaproteobacteria bacterium]